MSAKFFDIRQNGHTPKVLTVVKSHIADIFNTIVYDKSPTSPVARKKLMVGLANPVWPHAAKLTALTNK